MFGCNYFFKNIRLYNTHLFLYSTISFPSPVPPPPSPSLRIHTPDYLLSFVRILVQRLQQTKFQTQNRSQKPNRCITSLTFWVGMVMTIAIMGCSWTSRTSTSETMPPLVVWNGPYLKIPQCNSKTQNWKTLWKKITWRFYRACLHFCL